MTGPSSLTYLPAQQNFQQAVKTIAEDLSTDMFLAVHEPMQFVRETVSTGATIRVNELDLLEKVLETSTGPILVSGESGTGKTHIIKWLEPKIIEENKKSVGPLMHVVRVPWDCSIRDALGSILRGLQGAEFDKLRANIKNVKEEQLTTTNVADRLVQMMRECLEKLYQNKDSANYEKGLLEGLSREDIENHAGNDALQTLLRDPDLIKSLISESGKLYMIANQFSDGATAEERENVDYNILSTDLDDFDTGRLSRSSTDYIKKSRWSDPEEIAQITKLLNAIMPEAQGKLLTGFFGSEETFLSVFKKIREELFKIGKKLCILVEDLSMIRAIEKDLIDGLILPITEDGVQTRCEVHSVLAVTAGYSGYYLEHKETIRTRGKSEYLIEEKSGPDESDETIYIRIENLCARYLNASRWGQKKLEEMDPSENEWPPIWESDDPDEKELANLFGRSLGISLYPYNKNAIRYIAYRTCRKNDELTFNPRAIIKNLLGDPLVSSQNLAGNGIFPLKNYTSSAFRPSIGLNADFDKLQETSVVEAKIFSSIWSNGAKSLSAVRAEIVPKIAEHFGFDGLSKALGGLSSPESNPTKNNSDVALVAAPVTKKQEGNRRKEMDWDDQCVEFIDNFFREERLDQTTCRLIRRVLKEELEKMERSGLLAMSGLAKLPDGMEIAIGNSQQNKGNDLEICEEDVFREDESVRAFVLALYRREKNPQDLSADFTVWDYENGFRDSFAYEKFISQWLEYAVRKMVLDEHSKLEKDVHAQMEMLCFVEPSSFLSEDNIRMLNALLTKAEKNAISDGARLSLFIQNNKKVSGDWDNRRVRILDRIGDQSRYAIRGAIVLSIIAKNRGRLTQPDPRSAKTLKSAHDIFLKDRPIIKDKLSDFENADQFLNVVGTIESIVVLARDNSLYPEIGVISDGFLTALSKSS